MRFFLSMIMCVLFSGCSDTPTFPTVVPGQSKRLIIHSGANVSGIFPWAVPVTSQDVTIDFSAPTSTDPYAPFLNPTYIANPGDVQGMSALSAQYQGAFAQIIVDHMASGPHDTPTASSVANPSIYTFLTCQPSSNICYQALYNLLQIYYSMLAPGGTLIFNTNRYSMGDDAGGDQGNAKMLSVAMADLDRLMQWPSHSYLSASDTLAYLQSYYSNLLGAIGFSPVLVSVTTDPTYQKYNPSQFPYYYLSIQAQRSSTPSTTQTPVTPTSTPTSVPVPAATTAPVNPLIPTLGP